MANDQRDDKRMEKEEIKQILGDHADARMVANVLVARELVRLATD